MSNDPRRPQGGHRPGGRPPMNAAQMRRRRRQRRARRIFHLLTRLAVLGLVAGGVVFVGSRFQIQAARAQQARDEAAAASAAAASSAAAALHEQAASSAARAQAAAEAAAILADPRMVLVNHDTPMPEDYTFDTKECGSSLSINDTLQTEAADAFLAMQAAAAADGVTVWMQSGYRSVEYQNTLYNNKTQQYLNQGYDEATARQMAANVVNPPRYSEHNCGLAADLNCPEYTTLDEGFENTEAFAWLCEHAVDYGFILRYPKGEQAEAVTEITYEPWHWRYVGPENAARIQASGLIFEEYIAQLQAAAAAA